MSLTSDALPDEGTKIQRPLKVRHKLISIFSYLFGVSQNSKHPENWMSNVFDEQCFTGRRYEDSDILESAPQTHKHFFLIFPVSRKTQSIQKTGCPLTSDALPDEGTKIQRPLKVRHKLISIFSYLFGVSQARKHPENWMSNVSDEQMLYWTKIRRFRHP